MNHIKNISSLALAIAALTASSAATAATFNTAPMAATTIPAGCYGFNTGSVSTINSLDNSGTQQYGLLSSLNIGPNRDGQYKPMPGSTPANVYSITGQITGYSSTGPLLSHVIAITDNVAFSHGLNGYFQTTGDSAMVTGATADGSQLKIVERMTALRPNPGVGGGYAASGSFRNLTGINAVIEGTIANPNYPGGSAGKSNSFVVKYLELCFN